MNVLEAVINEINRTDKGVDPSHVEVQREVRDDDDIIVAVRFQSKANSRRQVNAQAMPYNGVYRLVSADTGWSARGSFVIAQGSSTARSSVWSSFGGFGEGSRSVLAGWVADTRGVSVRVTDSSGKSIEAGVANGVAILSWYPQDLTSVHSTELIDSSGQVIASDVSLRA